jgi:hypothetical protein
MGAEGERSGFLEVVACARPEDDAAGHCTASKPVPSAGSSSVPSPSCSFSVLMAFMRRVSNAKSLTDDAMALDMSHGENMVPERVYSIRVSKVSTKSKLC